MNISRYFAWYRDSTIKRVRQFNNTKRGMFGDDDKHGHGEPYLKLEVSQGEKETLIDDHVGTKADLP